MWVYQVLVLEMLRARLLSPYSWDSGQPGVPACRPRTNPGAQRAPTRPRTALLQVTLQTGHGLVTAGHPALTLRAEKDGISGGGGTGDSGCRPRATGVTHSGRGRVDPLEAGGRQARANIASSSS